MLRQKLLWIVLSVGRLFCLSKNLQLEKWPLYKMSDIDSRRCWSLLFPELVFSCDSSSIGSNVCRSVGRSVGRSIGLSVCLQKIFKKFWKRGFVNPIDKGLVRIYEKTLEQFLNLTQVPKKPQLAKKARNNSKIRAKLRSRIEENVKNRNCYCIRID